DGTARRAHAEQAEVGIVRLTRRDHRRAQLGSSAVVALEEHIRRLVAGETRERVAAGEDVAVEALPRSPRGNQDARAAPEPLAVALEDDLNGGGQDPLEDLLPRGTPEPP